MNPLIQPSLTAYYDARTPVIAQAASSLQSLGGTNAQLALAQVADNVRSLASDIDADRFDMIAVSVVDDLYKTISNATSWSEEADLYVGAVFGTFLTVAAERGRQVQYVVDNVYADLTRPLHIFPHVFAAAGLVYACPQSAAVHLASKHSAELSETPEPEELEAWISEGRYLAGEVVGEAARSTRHFIYLDADAENKSLKSVLSLSSTPGVVSVFRQEAPTPGSNVLVEIR